jgi:hypothetical protein
MIQINQVEFFGRKSHDIFFTLAKSLHEESIAFTRYLLTTRGRPWPNDLGR